MQPARRKPGITQRGNDETTIHRRLACPAPKSDAGLRCAIVYFGLLP